MREQEFEKWLRRKITSAPVRNYILRCGRVERDLRIDLDKEFEKDGGRSLLESMVYSQQDQKNHVPLRCAIEFKPGSDLRNGMASLKTAVSTYFTFRRDA